MGWGRSSLLAWTLPNYSVLLTYTPLNLKPTKLYTPLWKFCALYTKDLFLAHEIAIQSSHNMKYPCHLPLFMSNYTSVTCYYLFFGLFISQDKWNPQFLMSIKLWFHLLIPWCSSSFHFLPATSSFWCLGVGWILVLSSLIVCSSTVKEQILFWKLLCFVNCCKIYKLQTSDKSLQHQKVNHLSLIFLYLLHLRNIKHC